MNINTVYRCPYYGNSIACPNECNSMQHATLADKFYEYVGGKPVVVEKGDKLDMTLPKPIATVHFDAYHAGMYAVEVSENGNWTSRYCFGPTEEEE